MSREPEFSEKDLSRFRREEKKLRQEIARCVGTYIDEISLTNREDLARALGYRGTTQLSKWKSGKATIPAEKLALLAIILGCSITSFFPARVHVPDWACDLEAAVRKGNAKEALKILLKQLPDEQKK